MYCLPSLDQQQKTLSSSAASCTLSSSTIVSDSTCGHIERYCLPSVHFWQHVHYSKRLDSEQSERTRNSASNCSGILQMVGLSRRRQLLSRFAPMLAHQTYQRCRDELHKGFSWPRPRCCQHSVRLELGWALARN